MTALQPAYTGHWAPQSCTACMFVLASACYEFVVSQSASGKTHLEIPLHHTYRRRYWHKQLHIHLRFAFLCTHDEAPNISVALVLSEALTMLRQKQETHLSAGLNTFALWHCNDCTICQPVEKVQFFSIKDITYWENLFWNNESWNTQLIGQLEINTLPSFAKVVRFFFF